MKKQIGILSYGFTPLMKLNIQMFATPNNILLQDAKTGSIPTESGTLVLKEFMANSAVAQLAKYEEMTKPKKEFTYLAQCLALTGLENTERIQTSKATWLKAVMEAKKLAVIIPVSKEFLKFTVSDFFSQMQPAIAEAFYKKFDQAALFLGTVDLLMQVASLYLNVSQQVVNQSNMAQVPTYTLT
ncbi:hypothetical protein LSPH26S_05522 [Lysinibacillus sphaericus]